MTWVDWAIVIVLAVSVLGGLQQGFFRSVCSLGGLVLGLVLAAWNYARVAALLRPLVRIEAVADTIGFVLIALLVMVLAGIVGSILAKDPSQAGAGLPGQAGRRSLWSFAGRVAGHVVYPGDCGLLSAGALAGGRQAAQAVFRGLPSEHAREPGGLAERVREGLKTLEEESPEWMHPGRS